MNTDTNQLLELAEGATPPPNVVPVPEHLQGAAKELLEFAAMNRAQRRRASGKNKKGSLK